MDIRNYVYTAVHSFISLVAIHDNIYCNIYITYPIIYLDIAVTYLFRTHKRVIIVSHHWNADSDFNSKI